MSRLTQHPADDILDATRKLVLDKGVKSATVDAIAAAMEQTVLAVVDIPMGAVRRHLLAGSELPDALAEHLETAVRAILRTDRRTRLS